MLAEYTYYGNSFRASEHYDADADGDVDSNDPTYFFAWDERWRLAAVYRGSDSNPKERFLYHQAGNSGYGRSSYIDDLILRDRDANTAWTGASDGTLEQRRYYCQNWRHDVVAIVTSGGQLAERMRYSAYGVPFGIPLGDVNGDGVVNSADVAEYALSPTAVRFDLNLDGTVNSSDQAIATANLGTTLGGGRLSAIGNRFGYAGYESDFATDLLMHVRNRVYHAVLGRWTRRDPKFAGSLPAVSYTPRIQNDSGSRSLITSANEFDGRGRRSSTSLLPGASNSTCGSGCYLSGATNVTVGSHNISPTLPSPESPVVCAPPMDLSFLNSLVSLLALPSQQALALYAYTMSNPEARTDPSGLDCPGCDWPGDFGNKGNNKKCTMRCCAIHDECFDKHNCRFDGLCNPFNCAGCNIAVAGCFLACFFNPNNEPNAAQCYCHSTGEKYNPGDPGGDDIPWDPPPGVPVPNDCYTEKHNTNCCCMEQWREGDLDPPCP